VNMESVFLAREEEEPKRATRRTVGLMPPPRRDFSMGPHTASPSATSVFRPPNGEVNRRPQRVRLNLVLGLAEPAYRPDEIAITKAPFISHLKARRDSSGDRDRL